MPYNKFLDAVESIKKIPDNSVLAISGFNIATAPEYLIIKLWEVYKDTGHPRNLFIVSDTLPAIPNRGLDLVAKELYEDKEQDFIRGMLLPFLGWAPWIQKLTAENRIEMYTWPIGIAAYWFREIASGRPGLITYIGKGTFLDPRQDGGALNDLAKEKKTCKISVLKIGGEEYLLYEAPKPNAAFIRGTTADEMGNITMEKEGIYGTVLAIAQATKARPNPGIVIAQVEREARYGSLYPKEIHVPGPLIDYVVISPPEYHWQSGTIKYDPRISGRIIPPMKPGTVPKLEMNDRKVIARRITLEMTRLIKDKGGPIIVNLGIGIPTLVANIVAEEGINDFLITTVESGPWGGIALMSEDFGVSIGPFAIIPMPDMFTNYEGGIIDAASLGFMQVDSNGNVNPSMLPGRITGPGGFPVISAGSPRVYFGGGFTAGKRSIKVRDGKLVIESDGPINKFVKNVYRIVFNGSVAMEMEREILYITERAVFRLTPEGVVLEEIAPGVDLEKDILARMEFKPIISKDLKEMDPRIFRDEKMGLREEIQKG